MYDLFLSGGGSRGIYYFSLMDMREEVLYKIDRIGGCSVGALAAFILVCKKRGIIPSFTFETLKKLILKHSPLYSEKKNYYKFLEELVLVCTGNRNVLCKNFPELVIYCATMKREEDKECFRVERVPENMPVCVALAASSAIPLVFSPIKFEENIYVDAFVCNNFPLKNFIEKRTIGILLTSLKTKKENYKDNSNLFSYMYNLLYKRFNVVEEMTIENICREKENVSVFEIETNLEPFVELQKVLRKIK